MILISLFSNTDSVGITKLFEHFSEKEKSSDEHLEKQHRTLQKELKELKIRFGMVKIDKDTYELTFEHLNEQIHKISKELNNGKVKISNRVVVDLLKFSPDKNNSM